jgi:Arc/MetJ-type ribon-helix-helix transcriptional regulator
MVTGMATTKITITLPDEQIQAIRKSVAKGTFRSVSAYIQRAVKQALDDTSSWEEMLKESLEKTGGPLTAEEIAWADAILDGSARTKGAALNGTTTEQAA